MTIKNPLLCCIKQQNSNDDVIANHLNGNRHQRLKSRKLKNKNSYIEYLKKLDKIKAVIDNRPPPLYIESILKSQKLVGDFKRIHEIYKENQTILKRFDIIYRSKGIIDSDNKKNARLCHSRLKSTHNRIDKIENENITLVKRLCNTKPTITNAYLMHCWKYNLEIMRYQSRLPLILPGLFDNRGIAVLEPTKSLNNLTLMESRSRVFIELSMINGRNLGRITVLLFDDIVPKTVKNFLQLIRNFQLAKRSEFLKNNKQNKIYPNYVGTPLHRIFPALYIETGDITKGNGIGGQSADGNDFLQENFQISAKYTGTLAMIPNADGYVNSKFLITFKPLPLLDGKNVVFGRIINGLDILKSIEIYGRKHGKPQETIIISNSGVLKRK